MNAHTSTQPEALHPATKTYVVYDAGTGKVLHLHQAVTFGLAAEGAESQAVRALRHAPRSGAQKREVLEVTAEQIGDRVPFKIDLAKQSVVLSASSNGMLDDASGPKRQAKKKPRQR